MRLNLSIIKDEYVRDVLDKVQKDFNDSDLLGGNFEFINVAVGSGLTSHKIPHQLGFVPTDIITTRSSGSYTWNYEEFTKDTLSITTTTVTAIRCLIGRIEG